MTDMLERVARALAAHDGEDWSAANCLETLHGDEPEEMRTYHRGRAAAAIDAYRAALAEQGLVIVPREPTDAMLGAGEGEMPNPRLLIAAYRAMLDAAK